MTRTRLLSTIAVLAAVSTSTSGCGALLVGYLVGDAIQRNKATETCRSNLATTNQARIAKGLDAYPDQCGR